MADGSQYIGRLLGRTSKFVRAWADVQLAELDATVTDWILLFQIGVAADPGFSQTEAARFADMSGAALVRWIDRYEAAGLVVRNRDVDDRRVTRLRLTEAGEVRLSELRVVMDRCEHELRSLLSDDEHAVLVDVLDRVFVHVNEQIEEGQ